MKPQTAEGKTDKNKKTTTKLTDDKQTWQPVPQKVVTELKRISS